MKKIQLITDGACLGNPGPGGWAYILRYGDKVKEMSGSEPHTTNNRMELRAAIEGLRTLKEACEVEVITDSRVHEERHHGVDSQLEAQRMADGIEGAGGQSGPMAGTGRPR